MRRSSGVQGSGFRGQDSGFSNLDSFHPFRPFCLFQGGNHERKVKADAEF